MNKPIEIVVGRGGVYDPLAGATDCNIPILRGMQIWLEKIGYGTYDYDKFTTLSSGGFRLTGTTFSNGERWYVHNTGITYLTAGGDFSNGFNVSRVLSALFGRVGWIQTEGPVLNATNLLSRSGRRFNDGSFHSIVSLKNIRDTMEEKNATDNSFNGLLEGMQKGVILRTVNAVFNPPELLFQGLLYNRWGYQHSLVPNAGNFVGIRFKLAPLIDHALQVDSIGFYFDKTIAFNLVVYRDNIKAPLSVMNISVEAYTQTVLQFSDLFLNHIEGYAHGSQLYIGYFQSEIEAQGAKAIDETDVSFLRGMPFRYDFFEAKQVGGADFDRNNVLITTTKYGMSANVSVFRDHTTQIMRKAALFDNLIGLQMAAQCIEQSIYNVRMNGTERPIRDQATQLMARMDLSGAAPISESPQTVGLKQMIDKELVRVKESFFPSPQPTSVSLC